MTRVHQITPFLHVADMAAALQFFCDTLPFEVKYRESDYAYLELAGCGLRLLEEKGRPLIPDGKARVTVYVDVADVDALYAQLSNALDKLPPERVEAVTNREWKQREFQVRLPDGDWITFGQAVPGDT
jgi:catechol 2,3-dioxygenase-like lactoylglutathione lyase family enzyme